MLSCLWNYAFIGAEAGIVLEEVRQAFPFSKEKENFIQKLRDSTDHGLCKWTMGFLKVVGQGTGIPTLHQKETSKQKKKQNYMVCSQVPHFKQKLILNKKYRMLTDISWPSQPPLCEQTISCVQDNEETSVLSV